MSQFFYYCARYRYGRYTTGASSCTSPVALRSVNVFGMKIPVAWYVSHVICSGGFVWQTSVLKALLMIAKLILLVVAMILIGVVLYVVVPIGTMLFSALPRRAAAPFECGFEPAGPRVVPFCPKFWLVAILFLLFDVEVALLLPLGSKLSGGILFLGALVLGTALEYGVGSLD